MPFGQAFLEQATWIESPTPVTSVSPVNFGRESPFAPRFVRTQPTLAMGEMFGTIGEFYTALIQTLNNLVTDLGEPAVFPNSANVAAQYNGIDFLGFPDFSGSSTLVVANSTDAVTLLQDIKDEGEGTSPGIMWDETGTLLSHYYSFQEILLGRQYVAGDTPGSPSGPVITVPTGSQVLAMVENPTMDMYPAESDVWNAANSFNTAFGELVTSLQQAFSGTNTNPGATIESAIALMNSLQTEGLAVLAFPLPGNAAAAVAGPTFNNGFVPLTPCQQATIAVEQASTFVRDAQIAVDIARMGDNTPRVRSNTRSLCADWQMRKKPWQAPSWRSRRLASSRLSFPAGILNLQSSCGVCDSCTAVVDRDLAGSPSCSHGNVAASRRGAGIHEPLPWLRP